MTRLFATRLLLFGLATGAAASTADEPLPVDDAFALEVARTGDKVELRWEIADGYYLYRDHFRVGAAGTDPSFVVSHFLDLWIAAWLQSWLIAFPTVLVVAPIARRFVGMLVKAPTSGARSS